MLSNVIQQSIAYCDRCNNNPYSKQNMLQKENMELKKQIGKLKGRNRLFQENISNLQKQLTQYTETEQYIDDTKSDIIQSTDNGLHRQHIPNLEIQLQQHKVEEDNISLKRSQYDIKEPSNQLYILNEILSFHPKKRASIKARTNIATQQKEMNNILKKHDNNITDWMVSAQSMNIKYRQCKSNLGSKNCKQNTTQLFMSYSQCKSLWQNQQDNMESITKLVMQLTKQKAQLKVYVNKHKENVSNAGIHFKGELDKYNAAKRMRERSQNDLKINLQKLNRYCDEENNLNLSQCELLDYYNILEVELNEYKLSLRNCINLIKIYREFDSNDEKTINEMQKYFEYKWIECIQNWYQWNAESIICWIKYLLDKGELTLSNDIDLGLILNRMKNDKVNGSSLWNIDKEDLKSIGFEILNDRKRMYHKIQELICKYPHSSVYNEEGKTNGKHNIKIPKEFVCPLSNKIMTNPVQIFDSITYQKEEIQVYLNKYKKSPTTNDKCDADDIWFLPNRELKQKIHAFLTVNPQFL